MKEQHTDRSSILAKCSENDLIALKLPPREKIVVLTKIMVIFGSKHIFLFNMSGTKMTVVTCTIKLLSLTL